MEIESNVKRIIINAGFIKNELLCIVDAPEFHKKEAQRFRNDIYRLIRNCDSVFAVPSKLKEEVEDYVLEYQEMVIGIMEASEEKKQKIKQILEL